MEKKMAIEVFNRYEKKYQPPGGRNFTGVIITLFFHK